MKFTRDDYKKFNTIALSVHAKLQPIVDGALHGSPERVKNFVSENIEMLETKEGYEAFINAPELKGSKLLSVIRNQADVSIKNAVGEFISAGEDSLDINNFSRMINSINNDGYETVTNSIDADGISDGLKNSVRVLNSYEAAENGDFGLNRIFTTLSLRLAEITRAKIYEQGIEKYINVVVGQCGFKKELLRLGVQGQYLTAEQMAGAVGNIDFENTTSIEINQVSIPVIQLSATIRWNRINEILNQAIGLSLVDELMMATNTSFNVALQQILHVGVTSERDGTTIKGLLKFPDVVADAAVWTKKMDTNADVEAFAQAIVDKWRTDSQENNLGIDAIIRPFDTVVLPRSYMAQLNELLTTGADYPVMKTVKEYFKEVIEAKLSDMTDQDVNVTVLGSGFSKGEFIESKTGEATADTILVYAKEGSMFHYTQVSPFGFNTADNVTFQNRSLMFTAQPDLKFRSKDIMILTKGY